MARRAKGGMLAVANVAGFAAFLLLQLSQASTPSKHNLKAAFIELPWWSSAFITGLVLGLQGISVVYQLSTAGHAVDGRKDAVILALGRAWQLWWLFMSLPAVAAALLPATSSGLGQCLAILVASLGGLSCGCWSLARLHPLLERMRKSEASAKGQAALVRQGTSWRTAYLLFRLPTSLAAALCCMQTAAALMVFGCSVLGVAPHALSGRGGGSLQPNPVLLNPAFALLCAVLVSALAMLHVLEDVGFAMGVLACFASLIAAPDSHLAVRGIGIALSTALALRMLIKYMPEQ